METDVKEHKISKSPTRQRPGSANNNGLPQKKLKAKGGKLQLQYHNCIKKRSVALVLGTVQRKLKRLLSQVTEHSPEAIERALSNPAAEKVLKRQITDGSIQLVDSESQSPVFTRQMSKIG